MPVVAVATVVPGLGEAELDQAQAGVTPGVVNVADQPPVVVTVVHARRVDQPDVSTDPMVQLALGKVTELRNQFEVGFNA